MNTHNFYADLVLSLRTFFDRTIFINNEIKGYRFNIGNRSLQLKYETKFDLPWINIDYQSSRHISYYPDTWLRSQTDNVSKYQVLYDESKNLSLVMREELHEFQIQVTVNCESQLSALQLKHDIERYLIPGKYFQLYSFFSFFQIDDRLLHESIFDVNNDRIYNLFMQYDPLKDDTIYCFSVKYEPLVRMDTADISIGSSEQRSFPINMSLTIINPLPIYYEIPKYERGNRDVVKEFTQTNTIVPLMQKYQMLSVEVKTIDSVTHKFPVTIYDDSFNMNVTYSDDDGFEFDGIISGILNTTKSLGQFKTVIDNVDWEVMFERKQSNDDGLTIVRLMGPISGVIVKVKDESQHGPGFISGWFNGFVDGISHNMPISGQLITDAITNTVSDSMLQVESCSHQIIGWKLVPQPFGLVSYLINEFDSRLLQMDLSQTRFTEISFFYNLQTYTFPILISIDPSGNFKESFSYIIDGDTVDGCVFGKLNSIRKEINIDSHINIEDTLQIVALKCDFVFKSIIGYGAPIVNKINLNFTDSASPISSAVGSASYFRNEFIEIDNKNHKLLVQNVILNSEFQEDFFIPIDGSDDMLIKIVLSEGFSFDSLIANHDFYWRFYLNSDRDIMDRNTSGIELVERIETDVENIIHFKCTHDIFETYFYSKITIDNPIFFQLYKMY